MAPELAMSSAQLLQVLAAVPDALAAVAPVNKRSPGWVVAPPESREMGAACNPNQKLIAESETYTLSSRTTGVMLSWLVKWLLALAPFVAKTALNGQLATELQT